MRDARNRKSRSVSVVIATLLLATSCADVAAPPGGPVSNQYPQGYPPQGQPQAMQAPQSHPIRDLFASTIAAVLQTATMGIAGGLSGGIVNWFAAKLGQNGNNAYANAGYGAQQYPNAGYGSSTGTYGGAGYPSTASTYPSSSYPSSSSPNSTYPNSTYPSTGSYPQGETQYPSSGYPSSSYPTTASGYPNSGTQYPNSGYPPSTATYPDGSSYPNNTSQYPNPNYPAGTAQTPNSGNPTASTYPNSSYPNSSPNSGYPNSGYPSTGATAASGSSYGANGQMVAARDTGVYAGIAYEVHAFSSDGHWAPIDPLTYQFRSGDRFMVYYRPSLPGRMQVYNVNPAGQQTLIDATDMAAGQLAGLGPYEFTNLTGDESLRLVLSPCSTPQLLVATRDIVKADMPPPSDAQTGGGVHLENCSVTATRGVDVKTRDIQKVAADGSTSFALDPVSQQELTTGNVESRQVTIVFHHR